MSQWVALMWGIKPESRDASGNKDRSKSQHRAFDDGQFQIDAFAPQLVEVAYHNDAIEDGYAKESNESDACAYAQIKAADE